MSSQRIEREHDPDSQQSEQLVCPECESDVVWGAVYFELVCEGCGLVVDSMNSRSVVREAFDSGTDVTPPEFEAQIDAGWEGDGDDAAASSRTSPTPRGITSASGSWTSATKPPRPSSGSSSAARRQPTRSRSPLRALAVSLPKLPPVAPAIRNSL
jgi:hypothetical protein